MEVEQLIDQPGQAHQHWGRLSEATRHAVLRGMRLRYGEQFVRQFQHHQSSGTWEMGLFQGTYSEQRALHQVNFRFRQNYRSLEEAGFQVATNRSNGTWRWVHPRGFEIWVWTRARDARQGNPVLVPPRVDPGIEHPNYGRPWRRSGYRTLQAVSQGQRLALRGVVRPYDGGVIEVFSDSGENPWTLYPADRTPYGDQFVIYDTHGRRLNRQNGRPRVYTISRDQLRR